MKLSKKLLAVLLAAVMIFSVGSVLVLAENENPDDEITTTLNNGEPGNDVTGESETEVPTLLPPELETAVSELGDQVRENSNFFYKIIEWFTELVTMFREFFDKYAEVDDGTPLFQSLIDAFKGIF